ncbi:MAG: dsrJ [Rhodocyclaceae bacterium]|nr:dsrJ [Rhodocyclaceae bacterium]
MSLAAIARTLLLAAGLAGLAGFASADSRVPKPTIQADPANGTCVAPAAEMRRNHMDMLKHQRDKTLREGERGAKVSLNGCISCHAGKQSGSVVGSRQEFCESCHAYAAVKLDCFECHQPKAGAQVAKTAGGER